MQIELITIYVVTEVVSLAIFDKLNLFQGSADCANDSHGNFDVPLLSPTANAVLLTDTSTFQHRNECVYVIVYVQPIANVHAGAVDGRSITREQATNECRNELLGVLVWSVVVGTVGDVRLELVGHGIRTHEMIRRSLGCSIRRAWRVRCVLVERRIVQP